MWCIPPEQNADFVANMEDVLDVYALSYNKDCLVICIDEKPYQLLDERRELLPTKQDSPMKYDNEYERMGTCSIFVMVEPLIPICILHNSKKRRIFVLRRRKL